MKNHIKKLEDKIKKDGMAFVRTNRGLKLDKESRSAMKYISPRISSEYIDCSMPMTFDHYSHCSLGCSYCFAYMFKMANPSFGNKLHSINPERMLNSIRGNPQNSRQKSFYKHFYAKRFLLHWGGLADPFCNFEKANDIGYTIIKGLAEEKYPTLFSFKGSAIFRPNFVKLFEKYAHNKNFAFQISIIAPSDEISRKIEIGVPVTSKRIKAMKMLSDMGYYTILRLRPYIIGVTDDGIDELLDKCKEAGMKAISTEFMALDVRANFSNASKIRYEWLANMIGVKDIMEYYKALSPSKRGGYMRLNRLVKEKYVMKLYKYCIDNDILFACSDPDFKELNMSGSCCGMPDYYKPNRELENWTKNQLTYALKEARKVYNESGLQTRLKFNKVFKPDEDTYLKSIILGQDHPCVSDKTSSERHGINYLELAKRQWNNLRSAGNPRNYLDGKIMPIGIDEDDCLVYIYAPTEYEKRWKNMGIDLTK